MPTIKKLPYVTTLPLGKLFVDGVKDRIMLSNVRTPHSPSSEGYQRDPYVRMAWLTKHVAWFDQKLLRPVEVSKRTDGTYAIVDGGGRWVMAELAKKTEIECRVHEDLTRQEEAQLFVQFDREIYRLRPVDSFLAALAAGNPIAVGVNNCIKPYNVGKNGRHVLDCPGLLLDIYGEGTGASILRRTSLIAANTWGGLKKAEGSATAEFTGDKVSGPEFGAIALVIDAAPSGWNEGNLREVCKRADYAPSKLRRKVASRVLGSGRGGSATATTAEKVRIGAEILAQRANALSKKHPIDVKLIRTSALLEKIEARQGKIAFGNFLNTSAVRKVRKAA